MKERHRLLVADDDADHAAVVADHCEREGYEVDVATNVAACEELVREQRYDVALLDLHFESESDESGLDLLRSIHRIDSAVAVIMLTGEQRGEVTVRAMKQGAGNYLFKPINPRELFEAIRKALDEGSVGRRLRDWQVHVSVLGSSQFSNIIGIGSLIQATMRKAEILAQSDFPILISGETGVGKELFAEAIHATSRRRKGPKVAIVIGSASDSLQKSRLFGHIPGAFTDAKKRRVGAIASADGGTLFLDEVGDVSLDAQVDLLRVLEDKKVMPVGSDVPHEIDVRILAATNKDLDVEIAEGRFREDLFYRLGGDCLEVPPLRRRPEDIPVLASHFVELSWNQLTQAGSLEVAAGKVPSLSRAIVEHLQSHDWPGNVRELKNVVERAVWYSRGGEILPEHCLIARRSSKDTFANALDAKYEEAKEWFLRRYVANLAERFESTAEMAEFSGANPATINRWINKYRLRRSP